MTEERHSGAGITKLDPTKHKYAMNNSKLSVRLTYPYSDTFNYETRLTRINLDEERAADFRSGKGFLIEPSRNIKLDVKNQTGIFSNRYGSTIADVDSFNGKYRCKCGHTKGSIMHGEVCPICKTIVKFYDDDVSIFGWLILKEKYFVIHPNIYRTLEGFIGATRLNHIIEPDVQVNSDGAIIAIGNPNIKKDEPFRGIGMFEFRNRYDEILDYYLQKYPNKTVFYEDLKANKNMTFIRSLPVFSALLRPSVLENGSILRYQSVNENLMLLSKLVKDINRDRFHMDNKLKEKLTLLYDVQYNLNTVYEELKQILAHKKGDIRAAIGGRYTFSCRSVIRQDPYLKIDEIRLPFAALMELNQQVIINILVRSHNMSYAQAYKHWYRALIRNSDITIKHIIEGLIENSGGIPILINRNPTISYGGIMRVRCVGINDNYTMSISLSILKPLAADFDGDTLNILRLYNKDFIKITEEILSPKQMFVSRNDGLCDSSLLPSRDCLINANSLKSISRYNENEIQAILQCMQYD